MRGVLAPVQCCRANYSELKRGHPEFQLLLGIIVSLIGLIELSPFMSRVRSPGTSSY